MLLCTELEVAEMSYITLYKTDVNKKWKKQYDDNTNKLLTIIRNFYAPFRIQSMTYSVHLAM
jgi:hypothetical protein